ncbi:MAG TPA: methionine--tRNA ligase subunit beta [Rhodothermales bacterium]|nr:methionine--tRNA ligase subunit beta [Rhodothermales bacterium]
MGIPAYQPLGDTIDFDSFAKLDLRVATVISAERVEGTDKLLRLMVDLGFERRQILAGLAMHLKPEDLISRRVVIVANLKPRKIRGLESMGMLLAAETPDGKLVPLSAEADPGSVVR